MVFGNRGDDSGTGVAFTRDPVDRREGAVRRLPPNAQGEDVVAGIRNTLPLAELEQLDPPAYAELRKAMDTLEGHYRDMCDIEFTIEKRKFWLLQTRIGKRTALAEWVMAYDMLEEGLIVGRRGDCCASTRTDWRSCSSGASTTRRARRRGSSRSRTGSTPHRERRSARSCSAPTRRRSGRAAASP